MAIRRNTTKFRALLKRGNFIFMPVAYDPIGGRLVESLGFKATYTGGFVTGGSRCITEPMVTMREQVDVAGDVANAVEIPTLADGGAGFGEPMHTMRSVREFIRAGIAGIHIEDQFYPKRAHYHKKEVLIPAISMPLRRRAGPARLHHPRQRQADGIRGANRFVVELANDDNLNGMAMISGEVVV